MWNGVGIVREKTGLKKAQIQLNDMVSIWDNIFERSAPTPDLIGLRNAIYVGQAISQSALANEESVGAHYRSDAADISETMNNHVFIPNTFVQKNVSPTAKAQCFRPQTYDSDIY